MCDGKLKTNFPKPGENHQKTELGLERALRRKPGFPLFTIISIIVPRFVPSRQDRSLGWLQGTPSAWPREVRRG